MDIESKPTHADSSGEWREVTISEMETFISLLLYQGLIKVKTIDRYWSTKSLYHGLWARKFMSRKRFQAILAMLHVVDPTTEDPKSKLCKTEEFIQSIRQKFLDLH